MLPCPPTGRLPKWLPHAIPLTQTPSSRFSSNNSTSRHFPQVLIPGKWDGFAKMVVYWFNYIFVSLSTSLALSVCLPVCSLCLSLSLFLSFCLLPPPSSPPFLHVCFCISFRFLASLFMLIFTCLFLLIFMVFILVEYRSHPNVLKILFRRSSIMVEKQE